MKVFKMVCLVISAATVLVQAENTFSVFSIGSALPLSSAAPTRGSDKKLDLGWEAGWTLFGLPFGGSGKALSGLAFGGKISYNRWLRDSSLTELTMLGTQGIVRYYVPPFMKPFDLFVQAGVGMFIGEHGFNDPDTLYQNPLPTSVIVTKGIKNTGVSFSIGIDWDALEIFPGMTIVLTKGKPSSWYSINLATKF